MQDFPSQAQDVSASWMTQVLRASGALRQGSVAALRVQGVGNGLLGESARFDLELHNANADSPTTVVGKFPSPHAASRQACVVARLYLREVRFYQEIAPTIGMRTPRVHFADIDDKGEHYALLMEDLNSPRPGDQLKGCSVADVELAVQEAAALHAPYWGRTDLRDTAWLQGREPIVAHQAQELPGLTEQHGQRYGHELEPEVLAVAKRFAPMYAQVVNDRRAPPTFIHGDFRLDNVLFDVQGQRGTMATLDWQTLNVGPGVWDVAFFVGGGLSIEERREHEVSLVRQYHEALLEGGVQGYDWDTCWRDYRRYSLRSLYTCVKAAMSVNRSDRSDALFLKMARHHALQVQDLDAFSMWN